MMSLIFPVSVLDAFRELGVVLDARHVPRTLLLQQVGAGGATPESV